jgi:hypothetical protein
MGKGALQRAEPPAKESYRLCAFILFVLSFLLIKGLCNGLIPRPRSATNCVRLFYVVLSCVGGGLGAGLSPAKNSCRVRLFSVCAVLRVGNGALQRADPPAKESYRMCIGLRNYEKAARAQQRAVEPLMDQ